MESAVTDETGYAQLAVPAPAVYRVSASGPPGFLPGTVGGMMVAIAPNLILEVPFGHYPAPERLFLPLFWRERGP
jgi:hypothetical protein